MGRDRNCRAGDQSGQRTRGRLATAWTASCPVVGCAVTLLALGTIGPMLGCAATTEAHHAPQGMWDRSDIALHSLLALSGSRVWMLLPAKLENTGPIALSVELVAGSDAGALRAGETGWIHLCVGNRTDQPVRRLTAAYGGKGFGHDLRSTQAPLARTEFSGFGLASLRYAFVPRGGDLGRAEWSTLDPPDGHLAFGAHESRQVWRRIAAPQLPGVYRLYVVLDNRAAVAALHTFNNFRGDSELESECIAYDVTDELTIGTQK
jgi:hypothetical protein